MCNPHDIYGRKCNVEKQVLIKKLFKSELNMGLSLWALVENTLSAKEKILVSE